MRALLPGKHPCVYDETHFTPEDKGLVEPGVVSPSHLIRSVENDLSPEKHDSRADA